MQRAMRAIDLPGAGQHAAVFVRVRVAQHQLLRIVPGGQQLAIFRRAPKRAANLGRALQVLDRFEERHRHQPMQSVPALHLHAGDARQPDDAQHILRRRPRR